MRARACVCFDIYSCACARVCVYVCVRALARFDMHTCVCGGGGEEVEGGVSVHIYPSVRALALTFIRKLR